MTNDSVVVRDFLESVTQDGSKDQYVDSKDLLTAIPFIKDNEFNYEWITPNFINGYTCYLFPSSHIYYCISIEWSKYYRWIRWLSCRVSAIVRYYIINIYLFVR